MLLVVVTLRRLAKTLAAYSHNPLVVVVVTAGLVRCHRQWPPLHPRDQVQPLQVAVLRLRQMVAAIRQPQAIRRLGSRLVKRVPILAQLLVWALAVMAVREDLLITSR